MKINSVVVFWTNGESTEYNDVEFFDADNALGFPRLSIGDSLGCFENINLNHVETWTVFTEKEEETDAV